jgi:hypothetical protein
MLPLKLKKAKDNKLFKQNKLICGTHISKIKKNRQEKQQHLP